MEDSRCERYGALGVASTVGIAGFALCCVRILGVSYVMWSDLRVGTTAA